MLPTILNKAVVLSFLVASAVAEPRDPGSFIPYSDSGCTKEVEDATYSMSDINTGVEKWRVKGEFPKFTSFKEAHFPSAKSAVGGSGKQVWWKLAKAPGVQCHLVMMQQYSQLSYSDINPDQPPGNIFITAGMGTTGCFFSQLRDGAQLSTTYCCGRANCEKLSLGNGALYRRDDNGDFSLIEESVAAAPEISPRVGSVAARAAADVAVKRGNALQDLLEKTKLIAATATKLANSDPSKWKHCKVTNTPVGHTSAGMQTIIGAQQTCSSPPCTFSVSQAISIGTTLTRSQSTTITNGMDASIDVAVGPTWPVEATVSTHIGYTFSSAIAQGTDTGMTNTTTTTVTNTFGLQVGTTGFATFTPTLRCMTVEMDCGGGPVGGWHQCNPVLNPDGKTPQGDYNVVYVG